MTQHTTRSYDAELSNLSDRLERMGELARHQLDAAIDVLERRDPRAARHVVENDDAIDRMEHELSHEIVRLLALRAPLARDLREILAALRIAADIERIGDYAANVAKRSIPLSLTIAVAPALSLRRLASLANAGLIEVLAAYREQDADRAFRAWREDTTLDEAYTAVFHELLDCMMQDPRAITPCTHLLFMAKNIERIGDHVTNIAEAIWYRVQGAPLDVARDSHDTTSDPVWPHLGDARHDDPSGNPAT
ncbi:MAG TPA: phosphate signaling complex protein PhoU [Chiayiivirga sp.]|nr:phosphate signaling complex protein PhoU [Chiayiivirga sp.]